MRTKYIYFIHVLTVALTTYVLFSSGIAYWYWMLAAAAPLLISTIKKTAGYSFTINARILFPVSVGVLTVSLYYWYPFDLAEGAIATAKTYGIATDTASIDPAIFQVNPLFKDSVSVLYAICTAFLLWKGMSDFDDLKQTLYQEVAATRLISDFASYFCETDDQGGPNQLRVNNLRLALIDYLDNLLSGSKIVVNSANNDTIERCISITRTMEPEDANDSIALEEIMKGIAHMSDLRSRRTVCIEKSMSPFILALMLLMSSTMVAGFFLKPPTAINFDYLYIFLLPAFYTSILMTLLDLSSPFDGYWSIKMKAVQETREHLISKLQTQTINHPS